MRKKSGFLNKGINAMRGIWYALRTDMSVQLEFALLPAIGIVAYVLWPLSLIETALLILGWGLVLSAELLNTALEIALDRLHPDEHHDIGHAKDVAAGGVLIAASLGGLLILLVVIFRQL